MNAALHAKRVVRNLYLNHVRYAGMRVEPFLYSPLNLLLRSKTTRAGRSLVAQKYVVGSGLEIGAFASPTLVPFGARVRYVDRVPARHWAQQHEYKQLKVVEPDIIEDGTLLPSIPDKTVDFVMCFHMFEHVPNSLEAVQNWIRVLRPRGMLIVAVPDKRFSIDVRRQITPWHHFVRDYEEGPQCSAA